MNIVTKNVGKLCCCCIALGMFFSITACKDKDSNAPQVTLKGNSNIYLVLNSQYIEEGATATDPEDGDLIIQTEGSVDADFEGLYILTYSATDQAGNRGEALRVVHVENAGKSICGNFQLNSISSSDTSNLSSIISTSTTVNQRVWIQAFAHQLNAVVFCDITDNVLNIPQQQHQIMGLSHYFSGSGSIIAGDTLKLQLSFKDSTTTEVITGNSIYKFEY